MSNAHFTALDAETMKVVSELIAQLDSILYALDKVELTLPYVEICNDVAEPCGLIYFDFSVGRYMFKPDFTGEGIDREKLPY